MHALCAQVMVMTSSDSQRVYSTHRYAKSFVVEHNDFLITLSYTATRMINDERETVMSEKQ